MAKESSSPRERKAKSTAKNVVSPIYEAANNGDYETTKACIEAGADLAAKDKYGFTPLHRAASADGVPVAKTLAVLRLLLEAGSPLETLGGSEERTPLYLAAEFATSVEPVQLLLDAGADPSARDRFGNDMVTNARSRKVKQLLAPLVGVPVEKPAPKRRATKVDPAQWTKLKRRLSSIFRELEQSGMVALQNAGTTQDDGFSDCSERYYELGGKEAGLRGFCFYTRQDLSRAKATGELSLAFWGAPRGANRPTLQVGKQIVDAFRNAGFAVDWNETVETRPAVDLHSVK